MELASLRLDNHCGNPRGTLKGAATLRAVGKLGGLRVRPRFPLPEYFAARSRPRCTLPRLIPRKQFYPLCAILLVRLPFSPLAGHPNLQIPRRARYLGLSPAIPMRSFSVALASRFIKRPAFLAAAREISFRASTEFGQRRRAL